MPFDLDRRTRLDADRTTVTPGRFFSREFPVLAERHGSLVAEGIEALAAPPLAISVGDEAWTIARVGTTIRAEPGTAAGALHIALTPAQFSDLAQNQMTLNGFSTMRKLAIPSGDVCHASAWDSLWMTLLEGWPVTADGLAFVDRRANPLDLTTTFTPASDPADIAHFLREAGYLHLRGWLDAGDMARISAEMDAALPAYADGDGMSWWANLADGTRRCVRLQEFVGRSPTTAAILSGETWDGLRKLLAGDDDFARVPVEGRIIEALYKPVGVVSGPSDLSFHRDCHLGRHSYVCSRMTLGISITPSGGANGQLRVIAGSHRVAMPVEVAKSAPYLPVIGIETEPGDITVHLSCTLHASTPPVKAERRVLYTEIPLVALEGRGVFLDTSVNAVRDRINDLS